MAKISTQNKQVSQYGKILQENLEAALPRLKMLAILGNFGTDSAQTVLTKVAIDIYKMQKKTY